MSQDNMRPHRSINVKKAKGRAAYRMHALKSFGIVVCCCLLCLGCVLLMQQIPSMENFIPAVSSAPQETPEPTSPPAPTPEPTPLVETVKFSASGDNLIHSAIYQQAAANATDGAAYDFSSCYANMAGFYADYDVNWINQETLVSNEIAPSTYPTFCTPGECAQALYNIGFRVFSLSNNHSYDKGAAGIASTRKFWSEMPEDVVTTGLWAGEADYDRIPIQECNGIRIAYLSYAEMTNGIPTPSSAEANVIYTSETDVIEHQVSLAKEQADFVVVGVHWGVEDSHTTTDAQRALAQSLADWGADIVIGTHPHVLQDGEWLTAADGRQVFTAYSLGNFISTQKRTDNLVGGVLTFTIQKTTQPDGTIAVEMQEPKIHPIVTHYYAGTQRIQTYLYRDYTPELAQAHGVLGRDSSFSYDRVTQIINDNISPEYLDIT